MSVGFAGTTGWWDVVALAMLLVLSDPPLCLRFAFSMRYYFKHPCWELLPFDNINFVPAIYRVPWVVFVCVAGTARMSFSCFFCGQCREDFDFRLACPYPFLIDPTRKLNKLTRLVLFERSELEMHHMSYVRQDIVAKIQNVSNRGNFTRA